MEMLNRLKAALRPTLVYRPFLKRKEAAQEASYFTLRDHYYRVAPDVFGPPDYLKRSLKLLGQNWSGPASTKYSTRDVRLFVVDKPCMIGDWFESEIERNFDTVVFSLYRHKRGFDRGVEDLVSFATGVDPTDWRQMPEDETSSPWRARVQTDLLSAVYKAHAVRPLDLVFVYATHTAIAPDTLQKIKAQGVPVALLCLDDKHAFLERPLGFPNGQKPLIGSCDVHLTNSFECIRWYMAEGAAAYYFPQAIDPELYTPTDTGRDIPVSFVGQAYGSRFEIIEALRRAGIPVECFGPGWKRGRTENRISIYRRSQVNLGIGFTGYSRNMTCIKGRDFEIPATGSLYLTTYDPELSRLFHIGQEILCYRDEANCVEQIRYYLKRPDEAAEIARAGRERCLREHTWTHRLTGLLRWMGILENTSYP